MVEINRSIDNYGSLTLFNRILSRIKSLEAKKYHEGVFTMPGVIAGVTLGDVTPDHVQGGLTHINMISAALSIPDPDNVVQIGYYNGCPANPDVLFAVLQIPTTIPWTETFPYMRYETVTDGSGNVYTCQVDGLSGESAPSWSAVLGEITYDGSVSWICSWQNGVSTQDYKVCVRNHGSMGAGSLPIIDGNPPTSWNFSSWWFQGTEDDYLKVIIPSYSGTVASGFTGKIRCG